MDILKKDIKDLQFVAFDLETTGLYPSTSRIIEIGAVKFNLNNEISRFETLVDPEKTISHDSFLIHGITDEMVNGKPKIEEVLPDFINFLEDTVLIAHNCYFDTSFISYNLNQSRMSLPENLVLDTRVLAKKLLDNVQDYRLGTLVKHFNLPNSVFHRAIYDAVYCKDVFLKLIEIMGFLYYEDTLTLDLISSFNKPISFDVITDDHNQIELPQMYDPIREAISDNFRLQISYKKFDGEITERLITPLNFLKQKNKLYLEAFCHLRNERRTFKLSKIVGFSKAIPAALQQK